MSTMTRRQFDVMRHLARAYGHEWAENLRFDEKWDVGTRGDWLREHAADATDPQREIFVRWCDLHDRIESGYVPTPAEIEEIAEPLFHNEHFPTTTHVALVHETCTRRTRWEVLPDGEVRFEFAREDGVIIARARVFDARNGQRVAMIDALLPVDKWGPAGEWSDAPRRDRVAEALIAAGCSRAEAARALDALAFAGRPVCRFNLAYAASV